LETRHGYQRIVTLWTWAAVPGMEIGGRRSEVGGEGSGLRGQVCDGAFSGRACPPLPTPNASPDFRVTIALRADPLTAVMLVTVTFVSLLVAVYSVGYMHGDPGYWRFFTYIGLFVFSMTMLVSASNFVLLYAFWEAVGLCSYLLIGFWYQKPEAAAAGKKAFLVNRVGDFGFALGIFLIWTTYGTLDFHDTMTGSGVVSPGVLGEWRLAEPGRFAGGTVGTAICLLLLLGACGKSAQLPLHVWLPDAMEGPTPVSALIHAATMVTAGVYMLARCGPLFAVSPDAQYVVAAVGGLTALVAAVIAFTQNDLKRILAYSTISQLGYMFLAMGVGTASGTVAGMFHLVTHAFFKGLLFLGAGSVMHAMAGVIDIRRLGGLRRRMPVTCVTFLIGSLALAGVVPLAGFWSKDAILAALHERASGGQAAAFYQGLYWLALATAAMTAFYAFRAFFIVFLGPEKVPPEAEEHPEKTSPWMAVPLVLLAVATIDVGMRLERTGSLERFLERAPGEEGRGEKGEGRVWQMRRDGDAERGAVAIQASFSPSPLSPLPSPHSPHLQIALWSTIASVAGIALAWLMYLGPPGAKRRLGGWMEAVGLYRLSAGKFYFDQVYEVLVVWPLQGVASAAAWLDRVVIDGLVDLVGTAPRAVGALLRPTQGGLIPIYALAMIVGVLVLLGTLLASGL